MKKIAFTLLGLLMLLFAYFQLNDPDPARWALTYAASGILFFLAAWGKVWRYLTLGVMTVLALWGLTLVPSVIQWAQIEHFQHLMQRMQDSKMYIEETRECLGLFMTVALLSLTLIFNRADTK